MAEQQPSNHLTIFAFALSAVLALVLGIVMFKKSQTPAPVLVSATPTPVVSATPTPVVLPAGTPEVTPKPPERATPSSTPTPAVGGHTIQGKVLTADGNPAPPGTEIFVSARRPSAEPPELDIVTLEEPEFEVSLDEDVEVVDIGICDQGVPSSLVQAVFLKGVTEPIDLEIRTPGTITLRGRVSSPKGEPLAGIPISAKRMPMGFGTGEDPPATTEVIAVTDTLGKFDGKVVAAPRIALSIARDTRSEAYLIPAPLTLEFSRYTDETRAELNFVLESGAEVSGRVLDRQADPIRGADVRLSGPTTAETRTNADGRYRIVGLRRGAYLMEVSAPGYATRRYAELRIPVADQDAVLDRLATVSGHVVSADASTPVLAPSIVAGSGMSTHITTGADSSTFELIDLPPGPVEVAALVRDGSVTMTGRNRLVLTPGDDRLEETIQVAPLTDATVRLVGTGRHPVAELEASITNTSERPFGAIPARLSIADWPTPEIAMSESGLVRVTQLEAGEEYLLAVRDRASRKVLAGVTLRPPLSAAVVAPLGGTGALRGMVRNEIGTACTNTKIELISNLTAFGSEVTTPESRWTTTNFDGRFEFTGLPAGRAKVWIEGNDDSARFVTIMAGETLDISMSCLERPSTRIEPIFAAGKEATSTEQFLIISRPAANTPETMLEVLGQGFDVPLAPGEYSLVRTSTMERKDFRVQSNMTGPIKVDFTK